MSKQNNYAFIDSQNLNLGIQKVGWKLDWRKFREFLAKKYNVSKAFMFIGYMQENEALYEQMHDLGYLIVLKPMVEGHGEEEKKSVKGNIDADLVLYAMKELPNYDQAVIVSGDGDFFSLVEFLKNSNKLAKVMAPNWQYSSLLKPFEDNILRLDTMRRNLAYKSHKPTKKAA